MIYVEPIKITWNIMFYLLYGVIERNITTALANKNLRIINISGLGADLNSLFYSSFVKMIY